MKKERGMTKQEFLNRLVLIISATKTNNNYLDCIIDDVNLLLDEYNIKNFRYFKQRKII